jgi:rhamnose utilization protein RhaD (predicted bifunctional aldolase and dehydrogenase)/predicted GNAT family acetyltransferase
MTLTLLSDLWDDSLAAMLDEPELLRYRSNLLGSDPRLTNFGGGNTSAKIPMPDPVTGATATVLWVKGSGGDLGTIKRDGFATLYQDKLEALKKRYRGDAFEDEMVDLYPLCVFGTNPRAASIDTPLHAFLPFRHVDHLHPDWAIALAASANGPELLEKLRAETGLHLVWLPWKRPGFELGLWLEKALAENPSCDGIILGSHGIFTWGDDAKGSYQSTLRVLDLIGQFVLKHIDDATLFGGQITETRTDRRELARVVLPTLRGRNLAHFSDSEAVLRFVNSADAAALAEKGTSCPDHFVRTKVKPLFVHWDAKNGTASELLDAIQRALPGYRTDYAAYYEQNKEPDSPAIRSSDPSVVLIPGVGMLSFGKNKQEARITGEFYTNAIHVMEGATSMAANPLTPAGRGDNKESDSSYPPRRTGDGGEALACVRYQIEGDALYFHRLSVHPDYRRQGLAKKLVGHLEALARAQGLARLTCSVRLQKADNVALYTSLGFQLLGERSVCRDGTPVPTGDFEKRLA